MINEKVYSYLEKYLKKYLIGFNKEQLDVGLLSGSIELKEINLNAVSINKLFEKYKLPFALKAGTLGRLELKVLLNALIVLVQSAIVAYQPV
jgi:hypothetical protein